MSGPSLDYLAGVVDAKGHILPKPRAAKSFPFVLRVTDTERRLLSALAARFGGSISVASRSGVVTNWRWEVSGLDCEAALNSLIPRMVVRGYHFALSIDSGRSSSLRGTGLDSYLPPTP